MYELDGNTLGTKEIQKAASLPPNKENKINCMHGAIAH
jgi:hypothetical protein